MTVTSEVSRVSYSGDGSTAVFPIPFYFITAADLRLVERAPDGTETTLALGSDYIVSGEGVETGGSATLGGALAVGSKLLIYREPRLTQDADYVEGGRFPAASHERALDRIVMMVQRVSSLCGLALRLGETDEPGSGRYRAGGNRISDLGDPFDAGDAVNKGYFDRHASTAAAEASGYASDAAASATEADASAALAASYAGSAGISATTATTAAADAAASAANAAAVAGFDPALFLLKSGNLSGLADTNTARANLGLAPVASSGSYLDLANKPAITWAALPDKPGLSAVALSGAYNDLTGKPTLGSAASRNVGTVAGTVAAGDDARFDQSTKAPLNSPAFTGTPTAPTAQAGTNNTQIATTAFVMTNAGGAKNFGDIGSYVLAYNGGASVAQGGTISGGFLFPAWVGGGGMGTTGTNLGGGTVWRAMGLGASAGITLWVRVS